MTRKEAIKILNASDYFWLRPSENEAEALNMAIDALEQIESGRYIKGECNRCHKEYGVETRGLEEAIEQVEDLREAISTAPRVVIKNPRDCTITVDGSEYNPPQQVAQPEPEGIEEKKVKLKAIL